MPRIRLSNEEKAERKRLQQRIYYRKKKAERMGKDLTSKKSDLMISAELIQKNWLRIQRTVFSEDVLDYFVQQYQRNFFKTFEEDSSNFSIKQECSDLENDPEIKDEPEEDVKDNKNELLMVLCILGSKPSKNLVVYNSSCLTLGELLRNNPSEVIRKSWIQIQRTIRSALSENVQNIFLEQYQGKVMKKIDESSPSSSAAGSTVSLNNQKGKDESKDDIKENKNN